MKLYSWNYQMNTLISSFLQFVSHVKKSTDDQKWLEKSGNFCNTLAHENSRQMHVTCRHIRIIVWSVVPITAMYILAVFNMQINSHLVFTCQNPIWKIFFLSTPLYDDITSFRLHCTVLLRSIFGWYTARKKRNLRNIRRNWGWIRLWSPNGLYQSRRHLLWVHCFYNVHLNLKKCDVMIWVALSRFCTGSKPQIPTFRSRDIVDSVVGVADSHRTSERSLDN